ncbi:VTT domain-containing protein [Actinocatenispora sera]|uniref:DedA family protein n=1 Tax=Actinocatenispora sera TaxID=390989 RepID=UPI0033C2813B
MSLILLADGSAGGGLAGTVADWATKIMDVAGSPGAGLANALDSIIPVLPSEVILPLAGFAASRGSINLYAALVWTTIGSIVGSIAMYYIGAAFGRERVLRWAAKIPLVQVHEIERTEAFFRKHGTKAVFFGRFVPVFRSLISLPAGLERMPLLKFTLLSAAGSALWNTVFVLAGYSLGANWEKVEKYGSYFSKAIIVLIVLAIAYFVISRLLRRRRAAAGPDEADDHPGFAALAVDDDLGPAGYGPPTGAPADHRDLADHREPYGHPDPYGRAGQPPAGRTGYGPDGRDGNHPDESGGYQRPEQGGGYRSGGAYAGSSYSGEHSPAGFPPAGAASRPQHASADPAAPRHAAGPAPETHPYPGSDRTADGRPVTDGEPTLVKRFRGTVYGSSRSTEPDGRA